MVTVAPSIVQVLGRRLEMTGAGEEEEIAEDVAGFLVLDNLAGVQDTDKFISFDVIFAKNW